MAEKEKTMNLVGSKLTKVSGERNPNFDGKLELNTNINLKAIEKFKSPQSKQEVLKVDYKFEIIYGELGNVSIEGILYLSTDTKTMKEAIKDKDEKNFNSPTSMAIMNLIIQKSSIKAFEIEEELGLPIHIRLPTLQASENKN
jgi:hypothetical protein